MGHTCLLPDGFHSVPLRSSSCFPSCFSILRAALSQALPVLPGVHPSHPPSLPCLSGLEPSTIDCITSYTLPAGKGAICLRSDKVLVCAPHAAEVSERVSQREGATPEELRTPPSPEVWALPIEASWVSLALLTEGEETAALSVPWHHCYVRAL